MRESSPFAIIATVRNLGDRIRMLRTLAGETQEEFARRLGVTRGAVGNWERDKGTTNHNLIEIARKYPVDFGWLATGKGRAPDRGAATMAEIEAPAMPTLVPEVDARAGAGSFGLGGEEHAASVNGISISADVVRDQWGLPTAFLDVQLRIRRGAAWVIAVDGDSGYDPNNPAAPGSLFPGDRVIVDTSDRRPSPPGPFLLYDGLGMVVKLCEVVRGSRDPVKVRLSSRNPGYAPYEATEEEANIIGRVRGRISTM